MANFNQKLLKSHKPWAFFPMRELRLVKEGSYPRTIAPRPPAPRPCSRKASEAVCGGAAAPSQRASRSAPPGPRGYARGSNTLLASSLGGRRPLRPAPHPSPLGALTSAAAARDADTRARGGAGGHARRPDRGGGARRKARRPGAAALWGAGPAVGQEERGGARAYSALRGGLLPT